VFHLGRCLGLLHLLSRDLQRLERCALRLAAPAADGADRRGEARGEGQESRGLGCLVVAWLLSRGGMAVSLSRRVC